MTESESVFLKTVVPAALVSQQATGVPASITIAQAILESGWGQTGLAKNANNYFGIKAETHVAPDSYIEMPTHEVIHGQSVVEQAKFARYASVTDSFKAHGLLLAQASRYAPAMAVRGDAAKFAAAIQRGGYSTNPRYADLLMSLVREFDLTQYDTNAENAPAAPAKG